MKLRFENTYPFIASDYTLSPWVGLLVIVLVAVTPFSAGAQFSSLGAIEIEDDGELWIEGSASIVDYTCNAEELSGNGNIENTSQPKENVKGQGAVSISVSIPVHSLECGKKGMNKDMYEALKADKYGSISYQLLGAELVKEDSVARVQIDSAAHEDNNENSSSKSDDFSETETEEKWMNIKTTGILEIAGVKDTTVVFVKGKLLSDERFRVKGSKQINMKTFDIKPPTALLGLIKASSDLTVHFDVTVRLKGT